MRKNIFFALVAAIVLPLGFVACSTTDDNPVIDPDVPIKPFVFDAPNFFQNAIVNCDADGSNFEGFHWGKELYPETDPGHLYIGVDTWEEAEKIFRRYWMVPNTRPILLPPSEKSLKAELLDENGNKQMEVYMKPGEADNVVADVTVSDESKLQHFYKITFLKNEAWPTNAAYNWRVGDVLKNVTLTCEDEYEDYLDDDDKQLDFVCIRSSGNGVNPWFVTVSNHTEYKCGRPEIYPTYAHVRTMKYVPTYNTAVQIDSLMHDNWALIEAAWDDCTDIGAFPGTAEENEPYIDSCETPNSTHYRHIYNFDESDYDELSLNSRSGFFFEFDVYEDDEVQDNMTAYRSKRSKATKKDNDTCSRCSPK